MKKAKSYELATRNLEIPDELTNEYQTWVDRNLFDLQEVIEKCIKFCNENGEDRPDVLFSEVLYVELEELFENNKDEYYHNRIRLGVFIYEFIRNIQSSLTVRTVTTLSLE